MTTNHRAHSPVHYDPRSDSGIGSLKPKFFKQRAFGGEAGIYGSFKSPYDPTREENLDIDIEDDLSDEEEAEFSSKAFSSFKKEKDDPYRWKGNDRFYYTPAGGNSGHTSVGLAASHDRGLNLLEEMIREVVLNEISGRAIVRGTLGDMYPRKNTIGNMGATRATTLRGGGGNINRIGDRDSHSGRPNVEDIEEDETSFADYVDMDRDEENVNKHMKQAKRISKE